MDRFSLLRPPLLRLPLRYVIADRHEMICEGVKVLFDACKELKCVALVSDGRHLMETLCAHKPDILLTGLFWDGVSPLAIFQQCRRCMPGMGIIVLSMSSHPLAIAEIARAGASAFVSKNESIDQLLEVILRVATGQNKLFPEGANLHVPRLTNTERAVLHGIASGLTTEEIGGEIGRSAKTVEMHRTRLMKRFDVRKSTELVRVVLESGIILNSKTMISPLCRKALQCERHLKTMPC